MTKRHLIASVLTTSVLLLSACGNGDDTTSTGSSSEHGSGHSSSSNDTASNAAESNDADIAFLTGMIPHHEQAVEMSEMVLAANPPAEVAEIATQIENAQAPEIEQMNTMLEALGEPTDSAQHGEGHGAGHGGMMSDADMGALQAATGTEAARLYLEGMIEHHKGAIDASETEIAEGRYGPAIELAKEIEQAQAAELTEMEQLLASL
jgi:uncharacterized protein (DUF305 family)